MQSFLTHTHRNILWFKQVHEKGVLDMKPPFQRNPVWTTKQKSFLIDSILSGYPIPEIYMQDIISENGEEKYIVVDGQQRITACLDFISNVFEIDAKDSPNWANLTFDDLKPDEKKRIYEYSFVIRILPEIGDPELRAIFQRLNRNNIILNPQELRQATYWGPFIKTMNDLADLEVWEDFYLFNANDRKRMLDVEFISELVIAYLHGLQNKKLTLDKYYQMYEPEFEYEQQIKDLFITVLNELIQILPNINKTRWSKKTDFYTLFLIFAKQKDIIPLKQTIRPKARKTLIDFGERINIVLSTEKSKQKKLPIKAPKITISRNAKLYASAVRASSDLNSRKRRQDCLEKELNVFF